MARLISTQIPKGILKDYFGVLKDMGYVRHETMGRIMAYLFLLDWFQDISALVMERDYELIKRAMRILFVCGDCLLPYPVFKMNRTALGSLDFEGDIYPRISEDGVLRSSEDELLRITE